MDFATKVENDKRENTYIDPSAGKVSLRRYTEDWLNGVLLSGGTCESYERILRLHVLPHLGRKTIAQVAAADVEALYARWAKGRAKPNTIDARSIALSSLFSHAVRHRRISSNPVKEAEPSDLRRSAYRRITWRFFGGLSGRNVAPTGPGRPASR
ncbi:hypothetical protein ACFW1M_14760 [Streptomyces inhibens]|uniref:hypothetical protein n=1 Tax=Streptomyces inhibens TaxID=2293571 RepID=UPI0036D0D37A